MSRTSNIIIRSERADDVAAIHEVNTEAFGQPAEANLVDALREQATPFISLVATLDSELVGHIFFSPVTADAATDLQLMGLAPMAVAKGYQRRGIGSQLVDAGLDACRSMSAAAVVVLGHPEYYPRFGFQPASTFGVRSEYDVPDDVFMALELRANALANINGLVRYHAAFGNV